MCVFLIWSVVLCLRMTVLLRNRGLVLFRKSQDSKQQLTYSSKVAVSLAQKEQKRDP